MHRLYYKTTLFMRNSTFSTYNFVVFICLMIGSQTIYAQTISGIVKDKETEETLSFASINSAGTYGVITNSAGEFTLQTKYLSPKDSLTFSSLGYESKRMALKDIDEKTIYLHPTSFELAEVFLTNKEWTPEEIIAKVIENASENYVSGTQKFSIFKRAKEKLKNEDLDIDFRRINFLSRSERKSFNEELEGLIEKGNEENQTYQDSYFHLYQHEDEFKLDPVLATRLGNPDEEKSVDKILEDASQIIRKRLKSANTFTVKSGLFKIQDSLDIQVSNSVDSLNTKLSKNELSRLIKKYDFSEEIALDFIRNPENFDYELEGVTNLGEEFVYQINFEPQKNKYKYRGYLFISAETFAVVQMNYQLVEPQNSPGVLKFLFGIQHELNASSETVVFQQNNSGKYNLKYVHVLRDEKVYLNRKIKFIENSSSSDRIKLKAKLLIDQVQLSDKQYMFVNSEEISSDAYDDLTEAEKIPLRIIRQYDPEIWKDYNIISPDKAMREFN